MKIWSSLAAIIMALTVGTAAVAQDCSATHVDIRNDGSKVRFKVAVADDPSEQAKGLMFVESMPRFEGMLFVYDAPTHATFWMRNTLIPLDMLFVDQTGVVLKIHENAVPLSEAVIDGGKGVKAVLEINGGLARRLGIKTGAQMRHPAFGETAAAWPCIK